MPGVPPVEYPVIRSCDACYLAERRVLEIPARLHRWARDDPHRRFGDLYNLVADPAFLLVGWARVRGNKGAKTAGVEQPHRPASIQARGVEEFLGALRDSAAKDRSFSPLPSRERLIPKPGTAKRRQAWGSARSATGWSRRCWRSWRSSRIFEADFAVFLRVPPRPWVHDAVAEVRHLASRLRTSGSSRATSGPASTKSRRTRPSRPGARENRGRARPGAGGGVPEGGHPHRGRRAEGHRHRYSAGFDLVAVAQRRRPVGPGRALGPRAPGSPASRLPRGRASAAVWACRTTAWCDTPTTGR